MAGEEPQVGLHVELSHDAPITMLAALLLHFRDAVEHEHRRQRKLRVAGAEQLPARAGEQVVILDLLPPLSHWMSRFLPSYQTLSEFGGFLTQTKVLQKSGDPAPGKPPGRFWRSIPGSFAKRAPGSTLR